MALFSCIVAFWVAYKERNNRNIFFATLCFGIAVVSVHFLAILNTKFVAVSTSSEFGPLISNETLAVIVVLSSFIILCLFLWVSATFLSPHFLNSRKIEHKKVLDGGMKSNYQHIPCERDGTKVFRIGKANTGISNFDYFFLLINNYFNVINFVIQNSWICLT